MPTRASAIWPWAAPRGGGAASPSAPPIGRRSLRRDLGLIDHLAPEAGLVPDENRGVPGGARHRLPPPGPPPSRGGAGRPRALRIGLFYQTRRGGPAGAPSRTRGIGGDRAGRA